MIEFGGFACHGGGIDFDESGAARAGINLRQAQQCVEDAHDAVYVGDGAVDLGKGLFRARPGDRQLFQAGAQFRQRCAQVVRDCIGHVPDALDQVLDLVEHAVLGLYERIELAFTAVSRQPVCEISLHDGSGCLVDVVHLREQRAADQ
ncbi:hypothetical protein D9M72_317100 [compost metagenome]